MMSDTCKQCGKWPTDKPVLVNGGILCVDCASNLLRWRNSKEEVPAVGQLVIFLLEQDKEPFVTEFSDDVVWDPEFTPYWRPIGELPKGVSSEFWF